MNIRIVMYGLVLLLLTTLAQAAPVWQIVPNESSITFTATQNNAPVTGNFKTFIGVINFAPTELNTSNVRIMVDINSITSAYQEIADTLKAADWFDAKTYPQAIFTGDQFIQLANNTYQLAGNLTLRDKTLPVTLTFIVDEYSATKFHAQGSLKIKRSLFGIGRGEWSNTDQVKDEVQINFILTAIRRTALKP